MFQLSAHPIALVFFLAFRTAALLTYLLGLIFTSNFILIFVICILLMAFDFWTVKNVAGRLLVGLRWWNETVITEGSNGDTGTASSTWVFESADQSMQNKTDATVFWSVLYATPVLWVLLAIVAVVKLEPIWLSLVVIGVVLSGANALAYTKCDQSAKARWARQVASDASGGILRRLATNALGRVFNF